MGVDETAWSDRIEIRRVLMIKTMLSKKKNLTKVKSKDKLGHLFLQWLW